MAQIAALPHCVITGLGVTCALGQGKDAVLEGLLAGRHAFDVMRRPLRQHGGSAFIGAELPAWHLPERFSERLFSKISLSSQAALLTLEEAWRNAQLDQVDAERIGVIIGGSNLQQRSQIETFSRHWFEPEFIRPTYGLCWMDSDLVGLCSEQFGIRGPSWTVGGASASGQVAVIQGIRAVQAGDIDACVVMGALTDLSYFECQAFRSLGAMGSDRYADAPQLACRPFDRHADGFIYGEACAAVVIERESATRARNVSPWCRLAGWAMALDANRGPAPSQQCEVRVIENALAMAHLDAADIDYVNPHGSGSPIGDMTELCALTQSRLNHARINSTKSLTGHALCAAGTLELVATIMQMRAGRLHPSRNLVDPINTEFDWVGEHAQPHVMQHALNLSYGFGGINTAMCVSHAPG